MPFLSAQNATTTHIAFTRKLNTGDAKDVVISNSALYVLWAYSPTKPVSATSYVQHTVYSIVSINFLAAAGTGVGTIAPTTPAPTVATVAPSPSTGSTYTTPNGVLTVSWNSSATAITFTVTGTVTGYVSIGLNSVGLMAGADIYVGWVDAAGGTAHVADASSTGHSQPTLDTANGGTADTTAVSGALVRTQDK